MDFDLEATGFTEIEIELRVQELDFTEPDEPATLVGDGPSIVSAGELWKLGNHLLLCGDALSESVWRVLMGTDFASAVVSDPPYNVAIDGHVTASGKHRHREFAIATGELSPAEFTNFLSTAMAHAYRHALPGSIHYWAMDWRHVVEVGQAGQAKFDGLDTLEADVRWVEGQTAGLVFRNRLHPAVFDLLLRRVKAT